MRRRNPISFMDVVDTASILVNGIQAVDDVRSLMSRRRNTHMMSCL